MQSPEGRARGQCWACRRGSRRREARGHLLPSAKSKTARTFHISLPILLSELIARGCWNQAPHNGGLEMTEVHCLTAAEDGHPSSRRPQGRIPPKAAGRLLPRLSWLTRLPAYVLGILGLPPQHLGLHQGLPSCLQISLCF